MNAEKRLALKRIIIFVLLSFLPLWIITPIVNASIDGLIFEDMHSSIAGLYGTLAMLLPAIANILTRIITKEGIKKSFLCLNFKGNIRYYLASLFTPLAYGIMGLLLVFLVFGNGMSFKEMMNTDDIVVIIAAISQSASLAIFMFIPFFGEEFGWRAYLAPKMSELMPEPLAVLLSGIIWGLWHAPATCSGHNFGTDYPLFPFLGILIMCLLCASMSAFLTLVTKRTGSVFPAAITHGVNNQAGAGIMLTVFATESFAEQLNEINQMLLNFLVCMPITIVGIVCYIILIRDYLKKKKEN